MRTITIICVMVMSMTSSTTSQESLTEINPIDKTILEEEDASEQDLAGVTRLNPTISNAFISTIATATSNPTDSTSISTSIVSELRSTSNTEPPYLTPQCSNAEQLNICREIFLNSTKFMPADNMEALCKTRAAFSICLEDAVCMCQYPNVHPILETAYKDIMRNHYESANESCEQFQTDYTVKPGIICPHLSENENDHFRILQTTSEQPFIISLKGNCSTLEICFTQRDRRFEIDLYNKSLSAYCRDYEIFLKCFERKACECQMETDQSMLLVDDLEKRLFTETCSIITGVYTVIPGIACGGACSLSDPGVICTREFEKNSANSDGDEHLCRLLAAYVECYNRIVCECSLYQEESMYTAVSIAKYTFEVRSNCTQFPGVVFPSQQSGFSCPNDTQILTKDRVLSLNTSQGSFVKAEEEVCPGVTECYARFDTDGSQALYNKNLTAVCQAILEEIICLEEMTCRCGTLQTRFSSILKSKQNSLITVCGQSVIEIPPPFNCVGKEPIDETESSLNLTWSLHKEPVEETGSSLNLTWSLSNHTESSYQRSSNFGADAMISINSSQPQIESASGGNLPSTSSSIGTVIMALLIMTTSLTICQ